MHKFDRSSISQKLTLFSMLSTGGALLLVFIAFALASMLSYKGSERRQLLSLAGVIGASNTKALLTKDRKQAQQSLQALSIKDEIARAALFDVNGSPFARYQAGADEPPELAPLDAQLQEQLQLAPVIISADTGPFWAPVIRLYRPVRNLDDAVVGTVMLEADLSDIWRSLMTQLSAIAGATLLAFAGALLLTGRFRNIITEPITKLINAAQKVTDSHTYTHRIAHRRSDELGTLIDSFNAMLAQIESRDATLANYRDQLERQVGVRTEQLEKAKNAAEAASHAKSAFLATMSHEIRTPMNGVLGMTELLLGSELSEQQRHYTTAVKRSGENLLVIINDILDFSKIEAGKLTVEYIHFNFRELLDDVEYVFTPQAQAKGLRLEFAIANDIPLAICGDPNRLRQVLVNLLGNAVKFTDRGNITVKVRVTAEDGQSVGLRVEVHDSGVGVSSEAQKHIFNSFSQADGSTTRKHGGTGLGLAISKQLIELMGGKIGIDNALTQGSVFWFTVNFDKRRVDFDDPSFNQKATQGLRALIVDENPASRAVLERQLSSWRMVCDCAASATDCLRMLDAAARRGQPYAVALLDMELSRTSGLALAATIKADPAVAAVKLLLLSSDAGAADTVQRREAGVAFQLIKPPREYDLYECIVTPLRASEGARVNAAHAQRPLAARQRRKVLLAEDNPVNVEVAMAMLEGLGLDVVCARDGAEALSAVQAEDFDLVLMDCQMPVMDGFAATAEIRRLDQMSGRACGLPILAITANALHGDREACLAAGMDDYLSKPFTQHELGQTIGRWIALPRAATVHHDEAAVAAPPARAAAAPPPTTTPVPAPTTTVPTTAPAAASAAAHGANINRRALDNIRALSTTSGNALVQRVIHAYVDDTPQHFQTLRAAIRELDTGIIRKAAHSLKSSSANVGADGLAHLCKEMEKLGRTDSTEGASDMLTDMEQEFQAVRHSLSALLEKET
ncbi:MULTISPECIES: hybrid sensor histidine kinase/response regulator [unclassified Janthinobacterium]|uniref:hybrid sensor histidine kinase/response regulator n=1 Tax=unclassified Janthinobacterium TaxID=2610881 RepID=UPI0003490A9D|nr:MULTISPECIES: response regulator [unclassified Janthinobacterium]MEC5163010.1 two-component system sensor histidine kinase/response regulator [Janthinobacterium sp. CG_S6]